MSTTPYMRIHPYTYVCVYTQVAVDEYYCLEMGTGSELFTVSRHCSQRGVSC